MAAAAMLLADGAGAGAPAAEGACEGAEYRAFDFWIGAWTVSDATGERAGHNVIHVEQEGCLLVERWRGAQESTGASMNFYDPLAREWRQIWVSPDGWIDIAGGPVDGSMVLEGRITYRAPPREAPFRGTWTPLPDGRVRQFFEERSEEGVWRPWFEGFYRREDADAADR